MVSASWFIASSTELYLSVVTSSYRVLAHSVVVSVK